MKGDFTRNTFDPSNHFIRVLMQQGRVQLDADWNEQVAIQLHYLQTLAVDLIGPHGGPGDSFKIEPRRDGTGNVIPSDFVILPGHYYVDGILCENDIRLDDAGNPVPLTYTTQLDYPLPDSEELGQGTFLVYLDVWERHITYIEDESIREGEASILEVALNGPDTTTRAKSIWQVKTELSGSDADCDTINLSWDAFVKRWQPENRGKLKAQTRKPENTDPDNPCITPPEARYRGKENQLYRVEIHRGGEAWDKQDTNSDKDTAATFKWSRDNGSVVFPIRKLECPSGSTTTTVTLEHLGRDSRLSLQEGDWVEIVDDDYVLQGRAEPLLKVSLVERDDLRVTLAGMPDSEVGGDAGKHPLIRRWDQKEGNPSEGGLEFSGGAALVVESAKENGWLNLEDGIQIQFQPDEAYRPGDFWLIPARTATGDIEWPRTNDGGAKEQPPHGVLHHYAPLAVVTMANNVPSVIDHCRPVFGLARPPSL